MFYSKFMFVKKGPLSKVWLAAHGQKFKLPKNQVIQTDIVASAKSIEEPAGGPLALRLSGQLLLGLVRIYQKKVRYLQDDCNDALSKMKVAFRPGAPVDLPSEGRVAPSHLIDMPDIEMIDVEIPEIFVEEVIPDIGHEVALSLSVGRPRAAAVDPNLLPDRSAFEMDIIPEVPYVPMEDVDVPVIPLDLDDDLLGRKPEADVEAPEAPRRAEEERPDELAFDMGPGPEDFAPPEVSKPDESAIEVSMVDVSQVPMTPARESPAVAAEEKEKKVRRKRVRIEAVQEVVEIDKKALKAQIKDRSDIVTSRPVLPAKKSRAAEDVEDVFSTPSVPVSDEVSALFRRLTQRQGAEANKAKEKKAAEPEVEEKEEKEEAEEQMRLAEEPPIEELDIPVGPEDMHVDMEISAIEEPSLHPAAAEEPIDVNLPEIEFPELPTGPEEAFGEEKRAPREGKESAADTLFKPAEEQPETIQGGFSARTVKFYELLKQKMRGRNEDEEVSFESLLRSSIDPRHAAAGVFYELLVLKTHDYVNLRQDEPYADIHIAKTTHFDDPFPAEEEARAGEAQ